MHSIFLISLRAFCVTFALGALVIPYIVPITHTRMVICGVCALVAALCYVATYIEEKP